jgi:hypothetical protein
MARNVNTAESPTAKAMDRAIDLAIEGNSPYPEHAAFVDFDSPRRDKRSRERSMKATPWCSSPRTGASGHHGQDARGTPLTVAAAQMRTASDEDRERLRLLAEAPSGSSWQWERYRHTQGAPPCPALPAKFA